MPVLRIGRVEQEQFEPGETKHANACSVSYSRRFYDMVTGVAAWKSCINGLTWIVKRSLLLKALT